MNIELVVFDIAGTTVKDNNNVGEAFQYALKTFGFDIPLESVNKYMGYEKHVAIRGILHKYADLEGDLDEKLIEDIHQVFVDEMIQYYENTQDIEPLPNVEDTFNRLRQLNVKIALNTGFSRAVTDVILNRLGWYDRKMIDYVIASDEVLKGRPFPNMINHLMQESGITDPNKIAKVGDTEVDVNEGKNVGCRYIIGVTTGSFTREELESYEPTHIIDDMAELLTIIQQNEE